MFDAAPAAGSRASYETPLLFDPGERWLYGTGIDWAGQVVEAATGERLDSYLQREVFDPLGMTLASRATLDAVPARLARDPGLDLDHYGRELADLFQIATAHGKSVEET